MPKNADSQWPAWPLDALGSSRDHDDVWWLQLVCTTLLEALRHGADLDTGYVRAGLCHSFELSSSYTRSTSLSASGVRGSGETS